MMVTPGFHKITRQVSFFIKEKIRDARFVLSDATDEEILAEKATGENPVRPDIRTMNIISRAAFEVDQYERIVRILHNRFLKFDRKNWRAFYNALVLLEHLLIHGPISVAREFECDKEVIEEPRNFQYVDEKGLNWGTKVSNLSERVVTLLGDESYLKEERARCRKPSCGRIEGFGGLSFRSPPADGNSDSSRDFRRWSSLFNDHQTYGNGHLMVFNNSQKDQYAMQDDHPFFENEHEAAASLLPTTGIQ